MDETLIPLGMQISTTGWTPKAPEPKKEKPAAMPPITPAPSALETQVGGDHYRLPIQPVTFVHANGLGFIEGNVVKYVSRHRSKGKSQDIRKAIHFLKLLLQLEYGESE